MYGGHVVLKHPRRNAYVIMVDFDGTLCKNAWPEIGRPRSDLIGILRELQKRGNIEIHLHTSRTGQHLLDAKMWCRKQGLRFTSTIGGKPWASVYIDDKSLNPLDQSIDPLTHL